MPVENPFQRDFVRLLQEFRAALQDPGEFGFSLAWIRYWRKRDSVSQLPDSGAIICALGPDVPHPRPVGNDWYRIQGVVDDVEGNLPARQRFKELAADAGSALPPKLRESLRGRYWGIFNPYPVTQWCALLFALAEADPNYKPGDPLEYSCLDISYPFSASINAIAVCQLAEAEALLVSEVYVAQSERFGNSESNRHQLIRTSLDTPIEELEKDTPPWDDENGKWLSSKNAARALNVKSNTLATYRAKGRKSDNQMFGQDLHGRIWRRRPGSTPQSQPWYLRATLKRPSAESMDCG